ncbi:MAG: isoprenyl transferase [Rhizobiales bacterium TMED83]|nr:di-trans,poly-cis-decaprenylcistransferase [Rhodobiaceae bacterium]RPF93351.1 MAG: isoprenyl transferase [Rhizobiales bacterium TMED83]
MEPEREIAPVSHLAIVMDGNGRWAQQRNLPRREGHAVGVETVRRAVRFIADAGIECLTLFSFSTENWQRPSGEVKFLMRLLKHYIEADLAELHDNNVRVKIIGKRQGLDAQLVKLIEHAEHVTAENTRMRLQIAFNYGSREEIAAAAARLAQRVAQGELDAAGITPELVEAELSTHGLPDPDLIIRTSGENRLSNFLLWESAYSEFYFTDVLWPDFDAATLHAALQAYHQRERRFGRIEASLSITD